MYTITLDAFGQEYNAGCIDYRNSDLDRGKLRSIFASGREEESFFAANLSAKRFKKNYGPAVEKDAHLFRKGCMEWRRNVAVGREIYGEALCNPQDVVRSSNCTHDSADTVCSSCSIPVCNECWKYATRSEDIPKALCNDNFIGYLRNFFLEHSVTWLESTIACPLFSGLITYYIEGSSADRHHLMMEKAAQPRLSYGVRGNIFSFLMDWEQTQTESS